MFDVLFFIDFPEKEFTKNLKGLVENSSRYPNRTVGVVFGKKLMILPDGAEIELSHFSEIKSARSVLLRCGWPSFGEISKFQIVTQRLLIVEDCYPQNILQFAGYLSYGASSLGVENPSAIFASLHLPSLFSKIKNESMSNRLRVVEALKAEGKLRKLFQWKSTIWNQRAKAYKVDSLIEAIEWYRVPEGYLLDI